MALRVNDDSTGLKSVFNINRSLGKATDNIGRLSSGNRILRAAQDPAGLSIAQKLKADIVSQDTAIQNINQAAPQLQIAESALGSQQDLLLRGRELALQAANGTTSPDQRQVLNNEFSQLVSGNGLPAGQSSEFDRIAQTTEVGGQDLTAAQTVSVQAGTTGGAESQVNATIPESTTTSRGLDTLDISTQGGAQAALAQIDTASNAISIDRGNIGASINRLEVGARGLENQALNTRAARSPIADADFAQETAGLARNQIKGRAGIAALAQFNNLRGSALRLLG